MTKDTEVLESPAETTVDKTATPAPKKRRIRSAALLFTRWVIGALLIQSPVTAFMALGWVMQAMRREFAKNFCRRIAPKGEGRAAFHEWAEREAPELERWPGVVIGSEPGRGRSRIRSGLIRNVQFGFLSWFNVFLVTAPGCFLMMFGWYDGWNNSFSKGYEHAPVGPLTVLSGMAWIIAAMFYVPLAQARQAATGNWRRFFDFKLIWKICRRQRVLQVGLAFAYLAAGFPVMVAFSAPQFFVGGNSELANLSIEEARGFLWTYFAWAGLLFFPLFLILKLMAARVYAGGVLRGLREGWFPAESLDGIELSLAKQEWVGRATEPSARGAFRKVGRATWSAPVSGMLSLLIIILWFGFLAQTVVSQFILTRPVQGWINHPLVHLPWFSYGIPNEQVSDALPVTRLQPVEPEASPVSE